MKCISTVSYQFLVNGAPSRSIKPTRKLRQGDPLSPFLFILCQNILSLMLVRAESQGDLQGVKVSRGSPPINHLLFADDSYVFFRINVHSCRKMKKVLNDFCKLSGLRISLAKSELFTSQNCKLQRKRWYCGILGVKYVSEPSKYLGIEFGRMNRKKEFF